MRLVGAAARGTFARSACDRSAGRAQRGRPGTRDVGLGVDVLRGCALAVELRVDDVLTKASTWPCVTVMPSLRDGVEDQVAGLLDVSAAWSSAFSSKVDPGMTAKLRSAPRRPRPRPARRCTVWSPADRGGAGLAVEQPVRASAARATSTGGTTQAGAAHGGGPLGHRALPARAGRRRRGRPPRTAGRCRAAAARPRGRSSDAAPRSYGSPA